MAFLTKLKLWQMAVLVATPVAAAAIVYGVYALVTGTDDICRQITYERLKAAIQSRPYQESLRYFTLLVEGG